MTIEHFSPPTAVDEMLLHAADDIRRDALRALFAEGVGDDTRAVQRGIALGCLSFGITLALAAPEYAAPIQCAELARSALTLEEALQEARQWVAVHPLRPLEVEG